MNPVLRRQIYLSLTLVLLVLAGLVAVNLESWLAASRLQVAEPHAYTVARGHTLTKIAGELGAQGFLNDPQKLIWLARLQGGADRILAGEYELQPEQTLAELLTALRSGSTIKKQVTIIEGETFAQLLTRMYSAPGLSILTADLSVDEIMQRIGFGGSVAEGNFFPDTYFYTVGTTDIELLKQMFQTMQAHLDEAWRTRAQPLVIDSPQSALILASIIEKESGLDSERRRISGVFHRRMERGMRLQADSTIIYGLGADFDGDLRRRDMRRDTPYNSYLHQGLPPTAIALPGLASIRAAVNPDRSDESLYFVATGEGGHQFSTTFEEHNRAVRRYQLGIR